MTALAPIFVSAEVRRATSDEAWLEALLDAEQALAAAEARVGIIPGDAARAIAAACRAEQFDLADLLEQGRGPGNPVEPLVRALREQVGGEAADFVHRGATSQDILDTAAMLVSRRTVELILGDLAGLAAAAADHAERHARSVMVARTLLQQASVTTFGYKAACWLAGALEAHAELLRVSSQRLAVQLGGAVGTLSAFGDRGTELLTAFADEIGLARPLLPWHTERSRLAELAGALQLAAGAASKIALDVALLAQTEVGEVREGVGGVSSTLPHKQNPIRSTIAIACARGVEAAVPLLHTGLHEHERAIGAWHAEWAALSDALALTGGAVASAREVLDGLEVDTTRMRANLDASNGLVLAERLSFVLAEKLGRGEAQRIVGDAVANVARTGHSLRDELAGDDRAGLSSSDLDEAFEPSTYLGSAVELVESVLARYRSVSERAPAS